MKGILLLNGRPYGGRIDAEGARVYCCDGAFAWAKGKVKIYKNIGDFDSLKEPPFPPPDEVYPSEKDFTDGEIALRRMIDDGIDDITVYGAFGGREDHFLGNLQLLYYACARGVSMRLVSDDSIIFAARNKIELGGYVGRTISVFPFSAPLHILESRGFKYSYPQQIGYGECRGVSNIVLSAEASISLRGEDTALVIINLGRV